jgi:hypothetical protein
MRPTTISSRELILSIKRRLATLSLLERRLRERQAVLRKSYADSFNAHRMQMGTMSHGRRQTFSGRTKHDRYDQKIRGRRPSKISGDAWKIRPRNPSGDYSVAVDVLDINSDRALWRDK